MYKFNNGNGAVVCDICHKIIREGTTKSSVDICQNCQQEPAVVDNFDCLGDTLVFDNEFDFYWIQIIKRRKDNPGMHGDYVQYASYCVHSLNQFFKIKDEIIKICKTHNARAVLWVNRRNIQELGLCIASLTLEYIQSKQFKSLPRAFEHTCGKHRKSGIDRFYIVDLDSKDEQYVSKIIHIINECADPDFYIQCLVPTLHGFHIICTKFNIELFEQKRVMAGLDKIDIHKDNPTVLYFCPQ